MAGRKAITRTELVEVAAGLRRLLDAIAARELTAPAGTASRLEGAWLPVETVAGHEWHYRTQPEQLASWLPAPPNLRWPRFGPGFPRPGASVGASVRPLPCGPR
jgi:hypothetical protein